MDKRRAYFESMAEEWDKEFTAEDLDILSFLIGSFEIKSGSIVVDLGCGTGILFDMLRRKVGDDGMVIGVDYCTSMVKKAHLNFPFENVYEIDADAEKLPLMTDSADLAVCFATFAHFTDPLKVMNEVSRVLKSNGQFHIIHLLGSQELEDYHQKVGGPIANDRLPSSDDMNHLFKKADFINIRITDHPGLYVATGTKA